MRIEFIYDTVCPWCFVGKRRLERALARRPNVNVDVVWRPFLLNPDLPEDGIPRGTYLERKFGGPARVARMLGGLREAGRAEGIDFNFEGITRTPNSLDSHRLVRWASSRGKGTEVVEALFVAYFREGRDIGDRRELIRAAEDAGLSGTEARDHLLGGDGRGEIFMENAHTHRMSINGVPCFIFDGAYAIAGAQDPDILVRMIDLAAERSIEAPISIAAGT